MNKALLAALFLLSASFAAYTYTVDADRSGFAAVTLSMEGGDSVNVSLPSDASDFRVVGGSYQVAGSQATVSAGPSGLATFSFSTSQFTEKADSGWKLSFSPPEGAAVRIYAPPYAAIEGAFPQPASVSSDGFRLVIEYAPDKRMTLYYRLEEPPPATAQPDFLLPAALAVLAAALIAANQLRGGWKRPLPPPERESRPIAEETAPTLRMTPGKKEMMETFNANDLAVVNNLLANGGKSRRNELERKAGVSKSSLAVALNRLERRKILDIDRTSTTHFVKLSDYFLRL
jgi:uncharacterized membrane protein